MTADACRIEVKIGRALNAGITGPNLATEVVIQGSQEGLIVHLGSREGVY